jgi:cation diffusion facilitator family transporter
MTTTTDPCCAPSASGPVAKTRPEDLRQGLLLEYLTVGWNIVEGVIAVAAALASGSVALLGFGIDSFVETSSGAIMIWRLRAEQTRPGEEVERLEHRARRLVAVSLFALAAFVALDAARTLWNGEHPEFSAVGVMLAAVSMLVMLWLARAKRRAAAKLGSKAMEADAFQTTACWWLSVATLVGVGLNGLLGWWWADPVAALAIAALVAHEAREAWADESECC